MKNSSIFLLLVGSKTFCFSARLSSFCPQCGFQPLLSRQRTLATFVKPKRTIKATDVGDVCQTEKAHHGKDMLMASMDLNCPPVNEWVQVSFQFVMPASSSDKNSATQLSLAAGHASGTEGLVLQQPWLFGHRKSCPKPEPISKTYGFRPANSLCDGPLRSENLLCDGVSYNSEQGKTVEKIVVVWNNGTCTNPLTVKAGLLDFAASETTTAPSNCVAFQEICPSGEDNGSSSGGDDMPHLFDDDFFKKEPKHSSPLRLVIPFLLGSVLIGWIVLRRRPGVHVHNVPEGSFDCSGMVEMPSQRYTDKETGLTGVV